MPVDFCTKCTRSPPEKGNIICPVCHTLHCPQLQLSRPRCRRFHTQSLDILAEQVYAADDVENSQVDRAKAEFAKFNEALREAHTANEGFIKNRTGMIPAGAEVSRAAMKYKTELLQRFKLAAETGDSVEMAALMERITAADAVLDGINNIRTRMLHSMAEKNREYAKNNVTQLFPQVLAAIDHVGALSRLEASKPLIRQMREQTEAFRNFQAEMLRLWDRTDALGEVRNATRTAALNTAAEIASAAAKQQNATVANVVRDASTSVNTTALVCAVIFVLGLGVGLCLTRAITGPVARTLQFAQSVAAGALDRRLHLDQKDEIGQLSNALDSMVDTLNEKIDEANKKSKEATQKESEALRAMQQAEAAGKEASAKTEAMLVAADKLEEIAGIVSSASNELSAQIEQAGHGATEQAARVTETATAMEEMNSTVLEVAKNAGTATEVSTKTRQKADDGANIVQKAVASIRQVQQESLALKEDMSALNQHALSISQIMGVISDIADQTNLLALNAAIEAARAGEAGRGFAVVADEVRKLAEKTMTSTTDVGNAIKAIQDSATKSMAQVDRAVATIEEATDFANRSGSALQEIVAMADETADQVRAIATASEQQSAASEEINQSIAQVNTIASETARAMDESARAVSELAGQAHMLTELIEDMKRG